MELHTVFKSGTLAHSGCLLIAKAIYFFVIKPRNRSQKMKKSYITVLIVLYGCNTQSSILIF